MTVDSALVELRTEYRLLHNLMTNADRPLSKDRLLETVWGYEATDAIRIL